MKAIADVIEQKVRLIPNFPKDGILYYDITTLLADPEAFQKIVYAFAQRYAASAIDRVVAIESRGFLLGAPIAQLLGLPLVPVRKAGKLPAQVEAVSYVLEYGEDHLEIHSDALPTGSNILLVDDLIATGGTLEASINLCQRLGAEVLECAAIIELTTLGARERIAPVPVYSLAQFES